MYVVLKATDDPIDAAVKALRMWKPSVPWRFVHAPVEPFRLLPKPFIGLLSTGLLPVLGNWLRPFQCFYCLARRKNINRSLHDSSLTPL